MPTEPWPIVTFNSRQYYQVSSLTLIDLDPDGQTYFMVSTPQGGIGAVGPLVKGDPGKHSVIDTTINRTILEYGDPTPDSGTFIEITPGSDTVSQVVRLALVDHKGAPGTNGTSVLNPATYGTPVAKKMLVVNGTADGFVYQTQEVGDRYIPATINSMPSGNAAYTLATVSIAARDFDWRPEVSGYSIVTGTASDVQYDLIARLNDATAGNDVGRAPGAVGINPPPHILVPGPPAGSADGYDKVSAGSAATIYLRAERQNGTGTATTSNTTTRFRVKVAPVP